MVRNPKSTPKLRRASARTPDNEVEIAEQIGDLDDLDAAGIRRRWNSLFDAPPPKSMRRALLQRFIAHGLQVADGPSAHGARD